MTTIFNKVALTISDASQLKNIPNFQQKENKYFIKCLYIRLF